MDLFKVLSVSEGIILLCIIHEQKSENEKSNNVFTFSLQTYYKPGTGDKMVS